jgi:hypothetical protein
MFIQTLILLRGNGIPIDNKMQKDNLTSLVNLRRKHIFMKQIGIRRMMACSVALLALSFVTNVQAEAKQVTASVRKISGTSGAQVQKAGGEWTALKTNDKLGTGSTIKTGADTTVDVYLNNSVVRIMKDTTITLEKLILDNAGLGEKITQTSLSVKEGQVMGNVKKLAAASKYEIKMPNGVAGIRGTDFQITVTPLGGDKFSVSVTSIQGTIVGSAVNQQNVLVTAIINTGETWNPDEATVKILPPEVLTALQNTMHNILIGIIPPPVTTVSVETKVHVEPTTGEAVSPTEGSTQ